MPTTFRVRRKTDSIWTADHPELAGYNLEYFHPAATPQMAREALFPLIEEQQPGDYTLDMSLEDARAEAFAQIDERTTALINAGFVFEGIVFSCSVKAQVRYSTMLMMAGTLPYPLAINSLDDQESLDLVDANHTTGFCLAALNHVKGSVDSGTTQKNAVRAMTEVSDVLGFTDPRAVP